MQLLRKGPGVPGGHQVDHKAAMCPCGKGGQRPPGLHQAEHCQEVRGSNPSPLLSTGEMQLTTDPGSGLPSTRETGTLWSESIEGP